MPEQLYWRRALMVSCLIHCLLLIGAGWLGGSIISKAAEPEYIEMELIGSVIAPEQAAAGPMAMPQADNIAAQPRKFADVRPVVAVQRPVVAASDVVTESYSPSAEAAAPAGTGSGETAVPTLAASGTDVSVSPARKISAPRILKKVEPAYPDDARQDGFTGTVGVKIEVLENGQTGEVRLARSSGRESVDEAALQAVRKWRFVPAKDESSGRAVRCFTTLAVVFELR